MKRITRPSLTAFLVLSFVLVPDTFVGQNKLRLAADSIVAGYVGALNQTWWSAELANWIVNNQYKGIVDTFQSSDSHHWEFEDYCFKTRIESNGRTAEYSFFDNGDWTNPRAILQQVLIFDRRTKHNSSLDEAVWEGISDSLSKMYGPPSSVPEDKMLLPFYLGALREERECRFWQDSVKRIILAEYFRWEGPTRTDFILLLSRQRSLDSPVHASAMLEQSYDFSTSFLNGVHSSEICDSLRLLRTPFDVFCGHDSLRNNSLDNLLKCGEFVEEAERMHDSVHLPLYRAALYLFGRSYTPQGNGDGMGPWNDVDTLKHNNIIFEWSHLGEGWEYSKQPLIDLSTRYPDSRWGEIAFVELQNAGWCLDGMCNGNNGPEVISRGEEFLKRHPNNTFVAAILLTIAKGYETNWNVSTCDPESPYMYDENNRFDQDSRRKAIATYERIITAYPRSTEARIAKLRLPRLKLGINTGRRDFFFIYD